MVSAAITDMIASHTLAQNIITSHNTPSALLTADQLTLLQSFILSPDSIDLPSSLKTDNLATYIISTQASPTPALSTSDLSLLKSFFLSQEVDITNGAGPMIRSHTLAYNIILRPHEIFDEENMAMMREFCLKGMKIEKERVGDEYHSLPDYCAMSYGTEKSALSEQEVVFLKEWFEKGGPVPAAE